MVKGISKFNKINGLKSVLIWHLLAAFWVLMLMLILVGKSYATQSSPVSNSQRLVTIDASITEIVYALGEQHRLVGRDVTSTYPKEVEQLPSVGYMRALSTEGVLSLQPDMVITTADAKPSKVLDQLQQSRVKVFVIDNEPSVDGILHKVTEVARILGVPEKGEVLKVKIRQQVSDAQRAIKLSLQEQPQFKALFILGIRNGNLSVAGQGSRANALLKLLQVENPVEKQIKNYQSLSAEAAIQANPDLIVMIEQGVSMSGGKQAILNSPVLQQTQVAQQQKLLVLPNDVLNFGPRIGLVMQQVSQQMAARVKS